MQRYACCIAQNPRLASPKQTAPAWIGYQKYPFEYIRQISYIRQLAKQSKVSKIANVAGRYGHRGTKMKVKRENGLWIITAVVGGERQELVGKRLGDAIALLKRAQERAA